MIELAVQAVMWLVREQMQRIASGKSSTEPLSRLNPHGIGGTVVVVERTDRLADQLDGPDGVFNGCCAGSSRNSPNRIGCTPDFVAPHAHRAGRCATSRGRLRAGWPE